MPLAPPEASVVVLTADEAANIDDCLASLARQSHPRFEVLVVDAASRDGTVAKAQARAGNDPRLRVLALPERVSIGRARNVGVRAARGRIILFMSADAWADERWIEEAVGAIHAGAGVVFGRQLHAPPFLTAAAVSRGLRYHHFDADPPLAPEAYASNVNAATLRETALRIPFVQGAAASALDDVLFADDARRAGLRIAYNPRMIVHHKDTLSWAGEIAKNRREGYGWGLLRPRLGPHRPALAWSAGLAGAMGLAVALPAWWTLSLVAGAAYAPALRRATRVRGKYPASLVAAAVAAAPAADFAFLAAYFRGVAAGLPRPGAKKPAPGTPADPKGG